MLENIYDKIFEYIQGVSNKNNQPVIHAIEKYLKFSNTPLSNKQWNELFLPIIEKHDYTSTNPDPKNPNTSWEKTYKPKK